MSQAQTLPRYCKMPHSFFFISAVLDAASLYPLLVEPRSLWSQLFLSVVVQMLFKLNIQNQTQAQLEMVVFKWIWLLFQFSIAALTGPSCQNSFLCAVTQSLVLLLLLLFEEIFASVSHLLVGIVSRHYRGRTPYTSGCEINKLVLKKPPFSSPFLSLQPRLQLSFSLLSLSHPFWQYDHH